MSRSLAPPQTGKGQSPWYSILADLKFPTTDARVQQNFIELTQFTHQADVDHVVVNNKISGTSHESENSTDISKLVEQILKSNLPHLFSPPVPQCPAVTVGDLHQIQIDEDFVTSSEQRGGGDIVQDVNTLNNNSKTMPASTATEIWGTMESRCKKQIIWFIIMSLFIIAALTIYFIVIALLPKKNE